MNNYKHCIVPCCRSSTVTCPDKYFFDVPRQEKTRLKWLRVMNRDVKKYPLQYTTCRHVCQDHFDLEKDTTNLMRHRLQGVHLKLRPGVLPHDFKCQKKYNPPPRNTGEKRRRATLIAELLSEMPASTSTSDVPETLIPDDEPLIKEYPALEPEKHDKALQVHLKKHVRSKATSTRHPPRGRTCYPTPTDSRVFCVSSMNSKNQSDPIPKIYSSESEETLTCSECMDSNSEEDECNEFDLRQQKLLEEKFRAESVHDISISGRRIVDMFFFINGLRDLCDHGTSTCSFQDMVVVFEKKNGFQSGFEFKCNRCYLRKTVWTAKEPDSIPVPINSAVVAANQAMNRGYTSLVKFCATLDMPCIPHKDYDRARDEMAVAKYRAAVKEMEKAAEEEDEERRLALGEGYVDADGNPVSAGAAVGSWSNGSQKYEVLEKKPEVVLETEPSSIMGLETNLVMRPVTASDMIVEMDPTAVILPDVEPPDLSAPGPSKRMEPDSSMMEQDIHQALTCDFYPADALQPDSQTKIKEEPMDPDPYKQDILSATVVQELHNFSNDSTISSNKESSLFQSPALIKEEPISSGEES